MSTSTRITRSKGESDGLSLPMKTRPTKRDTTLGRNGGTVLSTPGWDQQQQMLTQMPHLTQSPEAASAERTATAPMLPPGPHRPLTPCMPLLTSPASSPHSSAPLFKEDRYSSTSEEESEADEVIFIHGKNNGTFLNHQAKRPTSTPTTSDYTTQGDPNASPSNLFKSNDMSDEFLGTNNFFVPDGSNRWIYREVLLLNCGTCMSKTIHALPQGATNQNIKDVVLQNHSNLRRCHKDRTHIISCTRSPMKRCRCITQGTPHSLIWHIQS